MLYVFHVDTGAMLTLDMTLAMESVSKLQAAISRLCHIPEDKQVLLISGGENLERNSRVCSYSSGTDTNPIFLFSKNTIEAATPPPASVNYGSDADLTDQVEGSMNMPATYETVISRTQLALQFHDLAKEELKICEGLVHDQHLQHQGWAAVVANLEDMTSAFKKRSHLFLQHIEDYLSKRDEYMEVLNKFPDTVQLLAKVPLLPCLMAAVQIMPRSSSSENFRPGTLLDWISAQDSRNSLDQMAQQCHVGLQQFDDTVKESVQAELKTTLDAIDNPNMKEVKGLEDRLFGLEQLMFGARKLVQEQGDMAQGFVQNQNRARNLQDLSVLPDLCTSHKRQLVVMLKNHQSMRDIRRRCMAAKEELSVNLHTRLRWVMFVEKSVCDIDSKLVIRHESLKKLKRRLEIIHQMHSAPHLYCYAVVEVFRRRSFANTFMQWAGTLCKDSNRLHQEEMSKRDQFCVLLKRHFLQTLFPGIHDTPPTFATKMPSVFDDNLPHIELSDIEWLQKEVPELVEKLRVPTDTTFPDTSGQPSAGPAPQGKDNVTVEVTTSEEEGTLDGDTVVVLDHAGVEVTLPLDAAQDISVSQSVEVLPGGESILFAPHASYTQNRTQEKPAKVNKVPSGSLLGPEMEGVVDGVGRAERREPRGSPGTSPDLEDVASEGFTTADFYIDESMPSSMTDSAGKKLAELQLVLQEKCGKLESRDKELEEQRRLADARDKELHEQRHDMAEKDKEMEEQRQRLATQEGELSDQRVLLEKMREAESQRETDLRMLQATLEKGALQLKCDILGLANQLQRDREEFQGDLGGVAGSMSRTVTAFLEAQSAERTEEEERLKREHAAFMERLEQQLAQERSQREEAAREVETCGKKVIDLQREVDELRRQLTTETEKLQTHLEVTRSQLMLEHEVELEKVHSDHALEMDKLSSQHLLELQAKVKELEAALTQVKDADSRVVQLESSLSQERANSERLAAETKRLQEDAAEERRNEMSNMEKKLKDNLVKETAIAREEVATEWQQKLETERQSLEAKLSSLERQLESLKENAQKLQRDIKDRPYAALDILQKFNTTWGSEIKDDDTLFPREVLENVQIESNADVLDVRAQAGFACVGSSVRTSQATDIPPDVAQALPSDSGHHTLSSDPDVNESTSPLSDFVDVAVREALAQQKREHDQEINHLMSRLERDKQDSLNTMKASFVAEKQVSFNEALTKVASDKDKEIADLMEGRRADQEIIKKLEALVTQSSAGAEGSSVTRSEVSQTATSDRGVAQERLAEELAEARQQILQLQSQLELGGGVALGQSVMPLMEPAPPTERLQLLEAKLRNKDEEIRRINQRMMSLSMSGSYRSVVQDKVSITTCGVGDVVLLCLDERHDHYVVFTVGTTLHFLHSDCLDMLGLKPGSSEARKSWVLAEITDKEYCQAKKAHNRFKVPVGTKFYRVKARTWNREAALQQAYSAAPPPASEASGTGSAAPSGPTAPGDPSRSDATASAPTSTEADSARGECPAPGGAVTTQPQS